jgi:integrase
VKLLACGGPNGVPPERRHVYAVASYTAMRQGELRGLRVGDVDFEVMQIAVVRQIKNGKEKNRTKNGRARVFQIEPNLVALLRVLVEGKQASDRLLYRGNELRLALRITASTVARKPTLLLDVRETTRCQHLPELQCPLARHTEQVPARSLTSTAVDSNTSRPSVPLHSRTW